MSREWRDVIQRRLDDLRDLDAISASSREPVKLDQQSVGRLSRMDAMQQQGVAKAEAARRSQELRRLEAALDRIEKGSFGACLVCGGDIAEKRLRADPAAMRCIDCAK